MPGLRERKKLATRQALSWAAMRLAVENGLANVLVEDIAAAAGVSPRTYNNYFASKEAAICAIVADRAVLVRTVLAGRPAGEPLADAVLAAVMAPYDLPGDPDRDWVTRTRLVLAEPALRGEFLKAMIAMERALAEGIAQRLGTDRHDRTVHRHGRHRRPNGPTIHNGVIMVVVVGAGPVGLMLAAELRLAGVPAVVLEQLPERSGEPRANGLVGQVVRLFHHRGCWTPHPGRCRCTCSAACRCRWPVGRPTRSTRWRCRSELFRVTVRRVV